MDKFVLFPFHSELLNNYRNRLVFNLDLLLLLSEAVVHIASVLVSLSDFEEINESLVNLI